MQVLSVEVDRSHPSFNCTTWNLLACSETKQKHHPLHSRLYKFWLGFWCQSVFVRFTMGVMTFITLDRLATIPAVRRDLLFIKSSRPLDTFYTSIFPHSIKPSDPSDNSLWYDDIPPIHPVLQRDFFTVPFISILPSNSRFPNMHCPSSNQSSVAKSKIPSRAHLSSVASFFKKILQVGSFACRSPW